MLRGPQEKDGAPLAIDAVCDYSTRVMGSAVQSPEGRQFKAVAYQLLKGDVDQIGQVIFGACSLDHRTEKRFAGGWSIRLNREYLPDEGQVSPTRSRVIVACQVSG